MQLDSHNITQDLSEFFGFFFADIGLSKIFGHLPVVVAVIALKLKKATSFYNLTFRLKGTIL